MLTSILHFLLLETVNLPTAYAIINLMKKGGQCNGIKKA